MSSVGAVRANNAVKLEWNSSLDMDSSNEVDMAATIWPDCMLSSRDDDMLCVPNIFSSTSLCTTGELNSQNLSSSSLSTSSSTIFVPPSSSPHISSPLTSERETDQVCATAKPSTCSGVRLLRTEGAMKVKSENVDHMMEKVDCAFTMSKESSDQNNSSLLSPFEQDFDCDDLPVCQLPEEGYNMEELLQLRPEELGRLDLPSLTSVLSSSGCEDCSQIMYSWAAPCPTSRLPSPNPDDGPESLSQLFTQWLKTNSDCFSIADLRKIKLKTSTIENATQRLGGGKKGMSYLLKLILIWIQNHHLPRKRRKCDVEDPGSTGLDDRLLNNVFCTASSIEDEITKGENKFRAPFGYEERGFDSVFSESRDQVNNVTAGNGMTLNEPSLMPEISASMYSTNLVPSTSSPYDAQLNNRGTFGRMPADLSAGLNLLSSMRQPQVCRPSANISPSLQYGRLSSTSNFPQINEALNNDKLWHASTVVNSTTALRNRTLDCFAPSTYVPLCNSLNVTPSTPAATTRAARKSRRARQRWSVRHARFWPSAGTNQLSWSSQISDACFQNIPFNSHGCNRPLTSVADVKQGKKPDRSLRLLLQKELKQSDVGNLGRIVLPKKEAESNLPYLAVRDGINLFVEDWGSSKVWNMRYRFWPNNKSRMYLLENTGDFVKLHRMKQGDHMILYADAATGKYVIRGIKVAQETSSTATEKSSSSSCRSSSEAGAARVATASPANTSEAPKPEEIIVEADSSRNGSPLDSPSSFSEALRPTSGSRFELTNKLHDDDENASKTNKMKCFPQALLSSDLSVAGGLLDLVESKEIFRNFEK